jgi:chloride channel 7
LEDSDAWRAHLAAEHYNHRGKFWNEGKHATMVHYILIAAVAIVQSSAAHFTTVLSTHFINSKFGSVYALLEKGHTFSAFLWYHSVQTFFAMMASMSVWIEPVSAGSGIPEVKCYLNGINIERVASPLTLVSKVLGVICSVSAGLPVGKEGPMVHSGAIVAATLLSQRTRNDREKRDFVACGAAAGVCTAFSAPIGGIIFALEERASYWAPSLIWRTFYCLMVAFTSLLLMWNTIGSSFPWKCGLQQTILFWQLDI